MHCDVHFARGAGPVCSQATAVWRQLITPSRQDPGAWSRGQDSTTGCATASRSQQNALWRGRLAAEIDRRISSKLPTWSTGQRFPIGKGQPHRGTWRYRGGARVNKKPPRRPEAAGRKDSPGGTSIAAPDLHSATDSGGQRGHRGLQPCPARFATSPGDPARSGLDASADDCHRPSANLLPVPGRSQRVVLPPGAKSTSQRPIAQTGDRFSALSPRPVSNERPGEDRHHRRGSLCTPSISWPIVGCQEFF